MGAAMSGVGSILSPGILKCKESAAQGRIHC